MTAQAQGRTLDEALSVPPSVPQGLQTRVLLLSGSCASLCILCEVAQGLAVLAPSSSGLTHPAALETNTQHVCGTVPFLYSIIGEESKITMIQKQMIY